MYYNVFSCLGFIDRFTPQYGLKYYFEGNCSCYCYADIHVFDHWLLYYLLVFVMVFYYMTCCDLRNVICFSCCHTLRCVDQ